MTIGKTINQRHKKLLLKAITYCILIPLGLIAMFPFAWMILASFKTPEDLMMIPPRLIPSEWSFDNFLYVLKMDYLLKWLGNTLFICFVSIGLQSISSTIVAYGFARFQVKANKPLFMVMLATMMIPWAVTMIPAFVLFSKIGWTGSMLPLTVPAIGGAPIYIFLIKQSIMSMPRQLDEAAMIDGCNSFRILWRIIVPNIKPVIVTMIIFSFAGIWGDFLGPFIYLNDIETFTLSLGVNMLRSADGFTPWNYMMAASAMFAVPVVAIYFLGMKFFSNGLVMSGIK